MPAIQTLLLFAHTIDTDATFNRFILDTWLEVEFVDQAVARLMIITATRLRNTWTQLIAQRLSESTYYFLSCLKTINLKTMIN
jgi:hypothetical protein